MVKLPKRFSVGERVFAKVRGYPPWPAKIESITDPTSKQAKYHVSFFGTKEIGTCKIEDLLVYADNKDKLSKSVRRKYFHEGIQELEEDLKKNPNPVSDSSKDSETSENVPENVGEDISDKDNEIAAPASTDGEADTGNLVIDEGDKKKAMKRKSYIPPGTPDVSDAKKKRGRKSMATILAENTPKQDTAHDSQDEDSEKKNVSRSGRKIKPKRFHDSDAEVTIESSKIEPTDRRRTKIKVEESNENQESPITPIKKRMSVESTKVDEQDDDMLLSESIVDARASPGYSGRLLVAHTLDGLPVGIKLDVNRPDRFESEAERARWDLSVARNAMRLKEQLESGDIAIDLIKDSLDFNVHVPEDEKKAKDEAEIQKELKLKTLRTEAHITFLDTQIRSSLGLEQANVEECLEAMDQMLELQITPLMLKKHSHIVEAIKRLRRYVGNLTDWNYTEEETAAFKQKADEIKKKAEKIYIKFKSLFTIPEGQTFWNTFVEQLEQFRKITKDMTQEEVFALIDDPTDSFKPTKSNEESSAGAASTDKSEAPSDSISNKNESVIEPENK
ncbi:PC4 and SFRS1-interacting protein isoform X1 [Nasonia vitripennis]|uniref:PWWP domain-containing protein n=1 Tax=Nasonia vitripennis TaxID=7425 RepID=A0A7M7R188_NASVI|nr:PC4 and SFRS1-interacting protein isoform X1 [Nasonia vitripennis]